jgi:hypothetical protein
MLAGVIRAAYMVVDTRSMTDFSGNEASHGR